ncbi:hypothetical protein Tco_1040733 [Tanacetum coccineum]
MRINKGSENKSKTCRGCKHGGSKQVGFKQLGPGVETGFHGVHDEKRVWFEVELQGAQGDRKAEVFQVSNDDTAVAQRRLEDKQPEEKTNTDCLVKEQKKEYQTGWKIKTGNVLDSCNQRNMGFNESGEYKKTFIGSGVARDKEQHSAHELLKYREDSNEAAFAVAEAEKIYAHESLTFNNTVACEVISKWKAGLKDDMDARSDVYVLSNGCKKCSDDIDVYYWEYTPEKAKRNILGMEIFRDQSGNTLRVSQSRFYNGKFVQTLLEGHSILSLKVVNPGDCDVEKNGKWSCIYAVRSQEYQMVCTRLDIASADVGMLDKFDHGLLTDVQVFVDFDYAMGYMILTEAAKEAIRIMGLAIESGFELKIVASIAIGALSKAIPGPRFQHRLKLLHIEDF